MGLIAHLRKEAFGTLIGKAFEPGRAHQTRKRRAHGFVIVNDIYPYCRFCPMCQHIHPAGALMMSAI
jgi:hypothetical protein